MNEDWVPLQVPDNLEEMFEAMTSYAGDKVGWCLLCSAPINAEEGMIPGTSTLDAPAAERLKRRSSSRKQRPKSRCTQGRLGHS